MDRIKWLGYEIRWLVIGALHVISGKYFTRKDKYGGHRLHAANDGNTRLYELISSGKPFAFCRYSYTEMEIMIRTVTEGFFGIRSTMAFDWLDIFCREGESKYQGAHKYYELMAEAYKNADILGIWDNLHMGDALLDIQKVTNELYVTDAKSVEAYFYEQPWTKALKDKRVLVVSPFSKAIRHQYVNRSSIWNNKDVLPEFELDTEDSIWYYAGRRDDRFANWFEAFDFLYDRIMSHEFDIAVLGCGYFGFPLASRIRQAGRQAVHMGGATQLLFGIKGKRWDNNPNVNRFYNDSWIRPDLELKPDDDRNLDDGCYW